MYWVASLLITRPSGDLLPDQCPVFGAPALGDSLAEWMTEKGPGISLEMRVGPLQNQKGLISQLSVHAIGPTEGEAIRQVCLAASELDCWLSLFEEGEDWQPCLPSETPTGVVTPILVEPSARSDDEPRHRRGPHHVGATARFLEYAPEKGLSLAIKVRATPLSTETVDQYCSLLEEIQRKNENASCRFDHDLTGRLVERIKRIMQHPSQQPFQLFLDLYSPEPPDAVSRVLTLGCVREWTTGICWLEDSMLLSTHPNCLQEAVLGLEDSAAAMMLKWMSGVRANPEDEDGERELIAAHHLLPF